MKLTTRKVIGVTNIALALIFLLGLLAVMVGERLTLALALPIALITALLTIGIVLIARG